MSHPSPYSDYRRPVFVTHLHILSTEQGWYLATAPWLTECKLLARITVNTALIGCVKSCQSDV